eukprot:COSAG03_NODE_596_length_6805_cov_73.459141_2_plen_63_part_00
MRAAVRTGHTARHRPSRDIPLWAQGRDSPPGVSSDIEQRPAVKLRDRGRQYAAVVTRVVNTL